MEGLVEQGAALVSNSERRRILRGFYGGPLAPLCKHIERMRRTLVVPSVDINDGDDPELAEAYREYDETLRAARKTDFDSMVYFAVVHLSTNETAREKWQSRFAFVIVDEAHDVSPDQWELAKLLAAPQNNLMAVLDPSQSIYSFRGSDAQLVLRGFENPKIFYLSENHRSGQEIIDVFLPFSEQDELSQELARKMLAARQVPAVVTVARFEDDRKEARAVAMEMCIDDMRRGECAILSRTRAELLSYAEELRAAGIPYNWRGVSFWQERDVERALSYCEYCANPKSGMPAKLPAWLRSPLARLADIATRTTPTDLLRCMRGEMGIGISFDEDRADDFAQENFDALVRASESFTTLADFLAHCHLAQQEANTTQGVTLSTIHAAKGLEWKNVFLVGMSRERMPHPKSENPDEERRLVFVALSRAKEYLWVSYAGEPSAFVETIERRKVKNAAGFEIPNPLTM